MQDLCKKLADKDETISMLQARCTETVHTVEKDYASEKVSLIQEKHRLESDLIKAKWVSACAGGSQSLIGYWHYCCNSHCHKILHLNMETLKNI